MKRVILSLCFVCIFLSVECESEDKKEIQSAKVYDPEREILHWLPTYSEVLGLVEKKAFREVDFSQFVQDSLKSAVSKVDAHSSFLTNKEYKSVLESTSGEFSGIGVSIIGKAPDDDFLLIVEVLPGSPAEKAGVRKGDKIIKIDKSTLRGLTSDEVINKLKGKVGSKVKIKVVRKKKPLSFTITRDIIKDQISICFYFKDQKIYYLSLKEFTENAAKQMSELLKKANKGKCRGIILDLRSNPGGTLDSAIDMAGLFLPERSAVVHTRDRAGKVVAKYFTKAQPVLKSDVPIFILINNFTASASEILAGCLRYHSQQSYENNRWKGKRMMVFLVGMPTFGKGSVQELIPIKNGCALKLTTMLYFLPDQTLIQAQGIIPDFLVKPKYVPIKEMGWIKEFFGKETSLKHHISIKEVSEKLGLPIDEKILKDEKEREKQEESSEASDDEQEKEEKKEEPKNWEERQKDALGKDSQVQAGVNMINMLNCFKKCRGKKGLTRAEALRLLKKNYLTDEGVSIVKVE